MCTSRPALSSTKRTTIGRARHRAISDRRVLDQILDAGLVCHLGVVADGVPVVLPIAYGRDGDTVYLHGSTGAGSLTTAAGGVPVCLTVTLVDGLVYARSVFHHSMNYRSAVVFGTPRRAGGDERLHGLRTITEHLAPGSWAHARRPTAKELAATTVLALDLAEASVKIRSGGPNDDPDDVATDLAWAGVLPVVQQWGMPLPAEDLPAGTSVPPHVLARLSQTR